MTFDAFGLSKPLLQAVADKGYTDPSPIQLEAIPAVLTGRDVMAAAQTGTGKTAGFTLPILQLLEGGKTVGANRARVLILTPTRELAAQIDESVKTYSRYLQVSSTVVFGGVKINPQMMKLRKGVDILVATPGRLLDLHQQNAIRFDDLEVLVLDEADRMLDMGFIHDIQKIMALLPKKRQNLLFSATFADQIRTLAKRILHQPIEITVSSANATADTVEQWVHPVDKSRKAALLRELVVHNEWRQVLVFSRTKHGANRLATSLEKAGINAVAIHGNKSQGARTRALAGFKQGKIRVLVATDIAARGLDIAQLPQVVNFDLPNVAEDYVHRIGRTGRAGRIGKAYSLVSADEIKQLNGIEQLIQKHIRREYVDGFEPSHEVPASGPLKKSHRAKRTNQSRNNRPRKARSGNHTNKEKGKESQNHHGRHKRTASSRSSRTNSTRTSGNR